MTQSIIFQDPGPSEADVSPGRKVKITLVSDDPALPAGAPDLYVQGSKVISAGISQLSGASAVVNDLLGYDIEFDHPAWEPGKPITVRVVADDTAAVLDEEWSFTVADTRGPVLASATSPQPGEILTASPASITIRIADSKNLTTVPSKVVDFQVTDANAEYADSGEIIEVPVDTFASPANQLYSATADFTRREGASIDIDGNRRTITTVHGPNLITYDGAQVFGDPVTAIVYQRRGLDIWVDGVLLVSDGIVTATATGLGWGLTLTTPGSDLQAVLTVPAPYADGSRIQVGVRVADGDTDRRNTSIINYEFTVGSDAGPEVSNHSPGPGSRALSLSSPGSDLQFDITDPDGVDSTTLNVTVNGVAAVTAGVAAAAPYAGCTVTPITNGFTVLIVRSTSYTDGDIAVVDIEADDLDTTPRSSKTSYIVQYGTTLNAETMNTGSSHIPNNNVIRVVPFDLTETSFGNPRKYRHNGFAYDGYEYSNGEPVSSVKSGWWQAFGNFPLAGMVVFTAGGWSIIDSGTPVPVVFLQVAPVASGWNGAGNSGTPFTDGSFGREDAALAVCDQNSIILVDFAADRAYRYSSAGRESSLTSLSGIASDQTGGPLDAGRAIDNAPHTHVDLRAWQDGDGPNRIIVAASSGVLTTLFELSSDADAELSPGALSNTRDLDYDQWVKIVFIGDAVLTAGNNSSQASATLLTVEQLVNGNAAELFIDDLTTPSLPSGQMSDADMNEVGTLAFAIQNGGGDVFYLLTPESPYDDATRTVADLSLSGIGSTRASAIALERDTVPGFGHLYAAVSEDSTPDSKAVRWREHSPSTGSRSVTVIANGASRSINNLAAMGRTEVLKTSYIRSYMELSN